MAPNGSVFGYTDDDDDYSGMLDEGSKKSQPASPAPSRRDMRTRPTAATPNTSGSLPAPARKPAANAALPTPARPTTPRAETPAPAPAPAQQAAPRPTRPATGGSLPAPARPTQAAPQPQRYVPPAPATRAPEPQYAPPAAPQRAPEPEYRAPEPQEYIEQPQYAPEQRDYRDPRDHSEYSQQSASDNYRGNYPEPRRPIYEEDDEPQRGKKGKNKGKKNAKKPANKHSRGSGGRQQVLIIRSVVIGGVVLLAGLGIKSVVLPPSLPSPDQIVTRVQEGLGVTNFPAEQGEGFVLAFAQTYLTYEPGDASNRNKSLENFTTESEITSGGLAFNADTAQKITNGPYVSGVRYTDDQNAIYTISAEVNGAWMYLAVPVYYDPTGRAFVVSSVPSLVPAPALAESPIIVDSQKVDDEASKSAVSTVNSFMTAWAASNSEGLDVVLDPEADARARHGLGASVVLNKVDKVEVYAAAEEGESAGQSGTVREAKVNVTWNVPPAPVEGGTVDPNEAPVATYRATYRMLLVYQGDGKWSVRDILPYGASMSELQIPSANSTSAG